MTAQRVHRSYTPLRLQQDMICGSNCVIHFVLKVVGMTMPPTRTDPLNCWAALAQRERPGLQVRLLCLHLRRHQKSPAMKAADILKMTTLNRSIDLHPILNVMGNSQKALWHPEPRLIPLTLGWAERNRAGTTVVSASSLLQAGQKFLGKTRLFPKLRHRFELISTCQGAD